MPNIQESLHAFIKNLNLSEKAEAEIIRAKSLIQDRLRKGLEEFSLTEPGGRTKITPRFFGQGSWAYKLVNMPAQVPPQQMDYDLGVYLPLSYLDDKPPAAAAGQFFGKVDFLMRQLSKEQSWLVDDKKQTCTRVVLGQTAHIDLPLYAIPDVEFHTLAKAAATKGYIKEAAAFTDQIVQDHMDIWEELPSDKVLLAMRNGTWRASDPRKLHNWFKLQVAQQGEQLRSVCRIVKAWRDHLWLNGGPSSIFLMVVTAKAFNKESNRVDLALLRVLKALPELLQAHVINPTDASESLSAHQKPEDLGRLIQQATAFAVDLEAAIWAQEGDATVRQGLVRHLGLRFPAIDPDGGKGRPMTSAEKAARVKAHDEVRPITSPWCRG